MGTRFLATEEAPIHQNIKDTIVKSSIFDTTHIFRTLKHTGRVYKNALAEQVLQIEGKPGPTKFSDLQPLVSGARNKEVFAGGDPDAGVWSAGPSMGLVKSVVSCDILLKQMFEEAQDCFRSASAKL